MSDSTRRRGFCADIARRLPARSLVHLRAVDRALQILERGDETDDSPLAVALRQAVHDIEADEHADDAAHERARDEMVPRRQSLSEVCEFDPPTDGSRHERSIAAIRAIAERDRPAKRQTVSIGNVPGDSEAMPIPQLRTRPALVDEPGFDPGAEFTDEQHLTRVSTTPDLTLVTATEPYAELDVSDTDQPIGVHKPGGESG